MENDRKDLKRPITYWIGEGAGWLLQHVVTGLAATGITPNMFTFFALGVNSCAAALFAMGQFRSAAAALFLAAFLDMADGQVARRVGRVTAFGAFLDSTLDRYSDLALYMGLVVYYTLIGQVFYMVLAARGDGQLVHGELLARARGIVDSVLQGWFYGAARAPRFAHSRRRVQSHGAGALGHRRDFDHHRDSPRVLHLAGTPRWPLAARRQSHANLLSP